MAAQDFVPKQQDAYIKWHDKFLKELKLLPVAFGIAAAEVTAVQTQNDGLHAKMPAVVDADAAAKAAHADLNTVINESQATARNLARRIKPNPAYDPTLGTKMGIVGPQDSTDIAHAKPNLKGTAKAGGVVDVDSDKLGGLVSGVHLVSQRGEEPGYTFLASETSLPYVDNRPLLVPGKPETRKYKAIFFLGKAEVGLESDVLEVTARP